MWLFLAGLFTGGTAMAFVLGRLHSATDADTEAMRLEEFLVRCRRAGL